MVKLKGSLDKVKRTHKQSFARQFLSDQNIQIYQNQTQILKPLDAQLYRIRLPKTQYQIGEQFAEQGETKHITSYEELLSLGLCITTKRLTSNTRWEMGQRIKYVLQFAANTGEHVNKIPKDHYVEYDAYNEVARIVGPKAGPLGASEWKQLKREKRGDSGAKEDPYALNVNPDEYMNKMYNEWSEIEETAKPIRINEVPIMITKNNEIVCLPKTGDMPSILINGMKGCLTEDTLISTPAFPEGTPITSLLNNGPISVNSYNIKTNKIEPKLSDGVEFSKRADVFELTSECGKKIRSTSDHPFLLNTGEYRTAIKINREDKLITVNGLVKITDIKFIGQKNTYDVINVQDNHNFIANGFVVSNSGKSFCLHSMVSRLFWKTHYNYKICILNDSSRETGTWCLPNNEPEQIQRLITFNESPLPLPVVYFHPTVKEDYEKLYMGDVGFDINLPWKKIIAQHDKYLNMKESSRYFNKIVSRLMECKNEEEVNKILDDLVFSYQFPANTATKVRAEIGSLIDSKMTDLSFKNQGSWKISKNLEKKYNPYTAAMHAGLLPVLSTEFISNSRNILSIYFNYFVEDLFIRQKQDPDFLEEQSELLLVIDECFTGDTNINTKNGPITLSHLYEEFKKNKELPPALSYNENTKKWEYKKIIKVIRKEQENLIEINLGVTKIKTTHNHKIHTPTGWTEAKKLKIGDLITSHYNKQKKNFMTKLNEDQLQIIYGSILGDGHLHKLPSNIYRLKLTQGAKQEKYLEWKKDLLNASNITNLKSGYTGKTNIKRSTTRTFVLPGEIKDNKDIPDWLIENITPKGIAIWYLDDGSINIKNNNVVGAMIHSNSYPLETQEKLKKMFEQKYNINVKIRKTKKYYYLGFTKEESYKLFQLIGPYIPDCMNYKLPRQTYKKYIWEQNNDCAGYAKIKSIKNIKNKFNKNKTPKAYVFDLSIQDNHNYIVCGPKNLNGILVHNCHNISMKGQRSTADMLLRRCVREGRPRRIGTLLATQKFTELPDVIKDNSTFLIVFKNPGEASAIASQYNLGKHVANLIRDLGKHEMLAYTTEHFIVYDNKGNSRKSKLNEVFVGSSLPPYSLHKKPNTEGGEKKR